MSLAAGTRLGPYEVVSLFGAGGMGEVYRARDSRLGRDVAIKALPASLAHDAERLARFEREARLLASLNHANIAAIYGLEEVGGQRYLVLEYVEGETLARRLAKGALSLDEKDARTVGDAEPRRARRRRSSWRGVSDRPSAPHRQGARTKLRSRHRSRMQAGARDRSGREAGEPDDPHRARLAGDDRAAMSRSDR